MPAREKRVTETELAILDELWTHGSRTIREIVKGVYGRHSQSLHMTVKSLLDRLAEKGHVACHRAEYAYRYSAAVDRAKFVGGELQQLADSHFGGSVIPMLLALTDRAKLSRKDREALRAMIDRLPR
jgi:BlaI family transcriptional regulator, penicillinase repressor